MQNCCQIVNDHVITLFLRVNWYNKAGDQKSTLTVGILSIRTPTTASETSEKAYSSQDAII